MTDSRAEAAAREIEYILDEDYRHAMPEMSAIISRHFADLVAERDGLMLGVKSMNNRITELEAENERLRSRLAKVEDAAREALEVYELQTGDKAPWPAGGVVAGCVRGFWGKVPSRLRSALGGEVTQ